MHIQVPHQPNPPCMNVQELRRKRLRALGVESAEHDVASVHTNHVIDLCHSSSASESETEKQVTKKPFCRQIREKNDDSEDDDEALLAAFRQSQAARQCTSASLSLAVANSSLSSSSTSQNLMFQQEGSATKKRRASSLTKQQELQGLQSDIVQAPSCTFTVATYNLWFGPQGDGNPQAKLRMQAIHDLLMTYAFPPPLFIGLQEVVPPLAEILFPLLEQAGYQVLQQPRESCPYGVATAVLKRGHYGVKVLSSQFRPYSTTSMGRGFLVLHAQLLNNVNVLFCNTHLESFEQGAGPDGTAYTGAAQRAAQLKSVVEYCAKFPTCICIITGDLNWDDLRPKAHDRPVMECIASQLGTDHGWRDAWTSLNANSKTGYTYDGPTNPMLGNRLKRRNDRILYWAPKSTHIGCCDLLGTDALPCTWQKYNPWQGTYKEMPLAPSDHFGVIATLRVD